MARRYDDTKLAQWRDSIQRQDLVRRDRTHLVFGRQTTSVPVASRAFQFLAGKASDGHRQGFDCLVACGARLLLHGVQRRAFLAREWHQRRQARLKPAHGRA